MAYMDPSQFGQAPAPSTLAGGSYFDPSGMGGDWLVGGPRFGGPNDGTVASPAGLTMTMPSDMAAKNYGAGDTLTDADAARMSQLIPNYKSNFSGGSAAPSKPAPSSGFDFSSLFGSVGGASTGTNSGTAGSLNAQWEAGVNNIPAADAVASRAAAQAAIQGGQSGSFSTLAKANMAKWDAYVAKSAALSKLTADQYAQYQAGGSYDASTGTVSLTGGGSGGGGGILSIFQGAKPAAASAASVAGAVTGGGQGSYFGAPKPASGTGPDTTTIVLFASLGIGALYLLGGGSTKRFRNPGGKVVRGAKRAVRSPVRFVKKLAKKIGF